jgi:hypothetical protein
MIRRDLKEARRVWLESFQDARQRAEADQSDFLAYRDGEGRYADFHALRHSFITMVGKAGVSPREHQDLARHSTYALTSRYSHSRFYDLAAAVQALPIPTAGSGPEAGVLAATGTDERPISLGPFLGPREAVLGDFGRRTETERDRPETQKTTENSVFSVVSAEKTKVYKNYPQGDSNPLQVSPKCKSAQEVTETPPEPLAQSLARETPIDPDLARLIDAWPDLPPTVKRMILAALEASGPSG